jgi:metal-dependent amidase/aminoacylase/carboxypeptidase family protein
MITKFEEYLKSLNFNLDAESENVYIANFDRTEIYKIEKRIQSIIKKACCKYKISTKIKWTTNSKTNETDGKLIIEISNKSDIGN